MADRCSPSGCFTPAPPETLSRQGEHFSAWTCSYCRATSPDANALAAHMAACSPGRLGEIDRALAGLRRLLS